MFNSNNLLQLYFIHTLIINTFENKVSLLTAPFTRLLKHLTFHHILSQKVVEAATSLGQADRIPN